MRWPRPRTVLRLAVFAGLVLGVLAAPHAASAQVTLDPTETPVKETGGWVYWMAEGAIILGGAALLFLGAMYLRFAPRFQRNEEEDTPRAGRRAPEPTVVLQRSWKQAAPPAGVQAVPAPEPAAVAAPAPAGAVAAAPPAAAAPTAAPTAAAPGTAPAEEAPAAAAPRPPRPKGEPVQLDQETFDRVLAEETGKGTSQRVAEGRARSAAVKAWRAKTGAE